MVAIRKGQYLAAKLKKEYRQKINEEIEIEESEAISLGLTQNENVEPIPQEPINIYDYLVFEAVDNCYFSFGTGTGNYAGIIEYSIDEGYHWNKLESNSVTPLILFGNKILFKGNIIICDNYGNYPSFSSTGKYKLLGNINSINYKNIPNFVIQNKTFHLIDSNCKSININTDSPTLYLSSMNNLTELTIPNSVTSLHLSGCSVLTELTIPNSITDLSLSGCSVLTELTIPNSVTNLSLGECNSLTELTIPSSVINLNILGCSELTEIEIPNSVTDLSLNYCIKLAELTIPNSVTNLSLYNCSDLTHIIFGNNITNFYNVNITSSEKLEYIEILSENFNINNLYFINDLPITTIVKFTLSLKQSIKNMYNNCYEIWGHTIRYIGESEPIIEPEPTGETGEPTGETGETGEPIPYQITYKHLDYIESSEFEYNSYITSVEIPNTIRTIEMWAFKNCINLESVIIPDSVTNLGSSVFRNCNSLTTISIPNSIYDLPGGMFANCISLQTFNIPKNIESIGSSCFEGCTNLVSIVMNNNIRTLGDNVFKNCTSLTSFNFNNITNIGQYCFYNCTSLTEINLIKSCHLGDYVFENCTNLLKVTLNNGESDGSIQIGTYAFKNCTSLTELNIICMVSYNGQHLNTFKYKIVDGCSSLNKITYLCSSQEDIDKLERDTWGTVANSGVFIKHPDVNINPNQIPEGWDIQDYVEE